MSERNGGEDVGETAGEITTLYTREFLVDLKRRCKVLKARREQVYGQGESLGRLYNLLIEAGLQVAEEQIAQDEQQATPSK